MSYSGKDIRTKNVKAEAIVSIMEECNFEIHSKGIFYRNYLEDIKEILIREDGLKVIELSRDGVFRSLPEDLFFEEDSIKNKKKKVQKLNEEKGNFELLFRAFDTQYFKLNLLLEKKINYISENETDILNEYLFGKINTYNNIYIEKVKHLLPLAGEIRADKEVLKDILENVFSARVEMNVNIIEEDESYSYPELLFIIHIPGLSKKEYVKMNEDTNVFFNFFYKWFLPVEVSYKFRIKDFEKDFILGDSLLLDYNTNLK